MTKQTCDQPMSQWTPATGAIYCNEPAGHEGQHRHTFVFQSYTGTATVSAERGLPNCPLLPRHASDCGTYIDVEGLRHHCRLVSPDCGGMPHECYCGFQWQWGRNKDGDAITTEDLLANFRRASQNQTVSAGVEGAHEGTTADKAHPHEIAKKVVDANAWERASGGWYIDESAFENLQIAIAEAIHDAESREPEKLNNAQDREILNTLLFAYDDLHAKVLKEKGFDGCLAGCPHCELVKQSKAALAESSLSSPPPNPQLVIACLEEAVELFELDDEVNTPGTDSWLWKIKSEQALIAYAEAESSPNFRESPELAEHGAESVHSGKQNTADKSELLPTQLPKEK